MVDCNFTEVMIHLADGASEKTFDLCFPKPSPTSTFYCQPFETRSWLKVCWIAWVSFRFIPEMKTIKLQLVVVFQQSLDIYKSFYIYARKGNDSMMIDDAGSLQSKNAKLTSRQKVHEWLCFWFVLLLRLLFLFILSQQWYYCSYFSRSYLLLQARCWRTDNFYLPHAFQQDHWSYRQKHQAKAKSQPGHV